MSVITNPVINCVVPPETMFPRLFCSAFIEYIFKGPECILPCPGDLAAARRPRQRQHSPFPLVSMGRDPQRTPWRGPGQPSQGCVWPQSSSPGLILTRIHDLMCQRALSPSPQRCPVPKTGAALVPLGCPAPGWGSGTGLGCQALPCHPAACMGSPPHPGPGEPSAFVEQRQYPVKYSFLPMLSYLCIYIRSNTAANLYCKDAFPWNPQSGWLYDWVPVLRIKSSDTNFTFDRSLRFNRKICNMQIPWMAVKCIYCRLLILILHGHLQI